MIANAPHPLKAGDPSVTVTMASSIGLLTMVFGLTMLVLARLQLAYSVSKCSVLPGVPQLKGYPIIGALPLFLGNGAVYLLSRLVQIGDQGISYATVAGNILVSVHDPAMVKEVMALPDNVASREGDERAGRVSWSPFWTLRRVYGILALFNYVGPDTAHQRNVLLGEFNNNTTNMAKFDTIKRITEQHCADIEGYVDDIRHVADNFAVALWGDLLYGNPSNRVDSKVLTLSNTTMDMVGDPWSAVWYYFQLILRFISPGQPTRYETKLRSQIANVMRRNIANLHAHEAKPSNTTAPKTIRSISLQTGGTPTGPLSTFATEFANLNLFGGHHSIGLNTVWALIGLDRHPEKMARLLAEVDAIPTMDFQTINSKTPYLDAVLSEVNRLYPSVHATVRVINQEVRLESARSFSPGKGGENGTAHREVILKPGMMVYISYLHLHTAEEYWGHDAKQFVPERFLAKGEGKKLGPLMSFGYGHRSCVGYKFSLLATKVFFVTLLKTYKVELVEHDHKMKLDTLSGPSNPVAVRITRR